jgi:uncharacterized protein YigA (DUF484 family)
MSQTHPLPESPLTALAEMLRSNPDIFQKHPELLELVTLSDSRGASSLLEKQVATLKARLQQFQSQQSEFIEVVRENEQISDSFVSIICQLIGFNNLSEFASEFPAALRNTFEIDEVSFKTAVSVAKRPLETQQYEDSLARLRNEQAVCDNRWPSSILKLFFSERVTSAALVPMKAQENGEVVGILALGSYNPERYTHELGTAHLSRLGTMAGICIKRLQP